MKIYIVVSSITGLGQNIEGAYRDKKKAEEYCKRDKDSYLTIKLYDIKETELR